MNTTSKQAWRDGMQAVHAEAGGVIRLALVDRSSMPQIAWDAIAGDTEAAMLTRLVVDTIVAIRRAPRRKPALCLSCPRRLPREPLICGAAIPMKDSPHHAIGFAMCARCAEGTADQVRERAVGGLRRLWPELRAVTLSHAEGGRA